LRNRLSLMTMLTSGIGLVLVCAGYLYYDVHDFQAKKVNELEYTAELLSANTSEAMLFTDSNAAEHALGSMRTRRDIRTAVLYQNDGQLFSRYVRRDQFPGG
jgi:Periplasmic sensor domain